MNKQLKDKVCKLLSSSTDISFEEKGEILEHICAGEVTIDERKKSSEMVIQYAMKNSGLDHDQAREIMSDDDFVDEWMATEECNKFEEYNH